jgi:flavorubredoxin
LKAVQIKENVYWVGGIDWNLRNFHGYLTQKGSTYNAYLIIDDKITLIDTVKYYHYNEMIERISSVIDPKKIDYVISNHAEMDHSGSLPDLMDLIPGTEIIATANCERALKSYFKKDWKFRLVKAGDSLNTGKYKFSFFPTPMVHWPDNMVTYLEQENILFSNDAFGQHLATTERFDDRYNLGIILEEAKKYYANIVLPYSMQVEKALSDLGSLKIDMIAPSHGIIWRKNIDMILGEYVKWASGTTRKKALIIYDTMWNSTAMMAEAIAAVFGSKGYDYKIFNLQHEHISDIMTEVPDSEYICVGSPTLNNNMLPSVSAFLTYMKGLAPKQKKGLAFGSFGWGGQSIKQDHDTLAGCNFTMLEPVSVKYRPDIGELKKIKDQLEALI